MLDKFCVHYQFGISGPYFTTDAVWAELWVKLRAVEEEFAIAQLGEEGEPVAICEESRWCNEKLSLRHQACLVRHGPIRFNKKFHTGPILNFFTTVVTVGKRFNQCCLGLAWTFASNPKHMPLIHLLRLQIRSKTLWEHYPTTEHYLWWRSLFSQFPFTDIRWPTQCGLQDHWLVLKSFN